MIDVARGGEDDRRAHVVRAVVGLHGGLVGRAQRLRPADDRSPQRVAVEDRLGQHVVHELLRRVLVHGHLFEHDLALGLEVGEQRVAHHVGDDREGRLELLVEEAGVDDRVLLRRGGVDLAAHLVEDARDVPGRVALAALEYQVLDEVRDAGLRGRLETRPGADPDAERYRADPGQPFADDPEPALERRELEAFDD